VHVKLDTYDFYYYLLMPVWRVSSHGRDMTFSICEICLYKEHISAIFLIVLFIICFVRSMIDLKMTLEKLRKKK